MTVKGRPRQTSVGSPCEPNEPDLDRVVARAVRAKSVAFRADRAVRARNDAVPNVVDLPAGEARMREPPAPIACVGGCFTRSEPLAPLNQAQKEALDRWRVRGRC